ncbi:N-acylethanolamine-hydrolyzing acid amidase-like isoform X2 [Thalassophryne amazonica]|uniref:N-acylethanolamine-hydrolyzing acid amidase-like isoform X2 n=1 Tax=Thalassophryne amazonica TaxID=390379 RepID=UPI0014723CF0|nr:N-acylethanolamine-hydrolyzing acid amidase-like isoform X2 [Thalassophryne amazonica]
MMFVTTAALLLGLTVYARTDVAPPTVTVNLAEPPEQRWTVLLKVFDLSFLKKAAADVIDTTVPKWVHHAIKPVVMALEKYIPQPYAGEIRGMASQFGGSLSDVIILNFAYEISAFCTSIVAQDTNGHVYHGRNLDYPHPVLRNLTVNIIFLKDGETLEEAENFEDAVMRLSKIPIITEVYYIVGGLQPGEGAVITRDRSGPADIWPLDPVTGGWYRVETNFDHWLPPPGRDHRREAAIKALNATGQDHINMKTLYQILSVYPVCNRGTVYTTIMSAEKTEKYTTLVRPQGCLKSS